MLISLLVACATMHHGPEGVEGDLIASPEDARLLMDGDLAQEALARSNGGKNSVYVSTKVSRDGSSQTTVQLGPNYGYGQPGGVVYASASDFELMQAARLTADYRDAYARTNGLVPPSAPSGTQYQSSTSASDRIDPTAKCPEGKPNASWTQAQLDACQSAAIKAIVGVRGVK